MLPVSPPTGYARLTSTQARTILVLAAISTMILVGISLSSLQSSMVDKERGGEGDVALYLAKVERIHAGASYYEAAAAEMIERGYPTRSVFNWRMPLPMWMLGKMPVLGIGKVMLGLLALALIVFGFEAMAREQGHGLGPPLVSALLLTGPLLFYVLGDLYVSPALWAGVLVGLSICAYGIERPILGMLLGISALFFRELVLPYCVLAAGLAWWESRRKETAYWLLGLFLWLTFYIWHCQHVLGLMPLDGRAHSDGWLQFGGAAFVISTAQMNAYLLLLPQWLTAIYLAAALLGFAGWHTRLGLRVGVTGCLFIMAFALVGQPFNQYWGCLFAPILCFGVARAPSSIRDLWRAAKGLSEKGNRQLAFASNSPNQRIATRSQ